LRHGKKDTMYQPYPGRDTELPDTQLPQAQRPPAPASERIAAGVIAAVVFLWRRTPSAYFRPRA
jgi:hypothetical protein